jgi:hypothetical protein
MAFGEVGAATAHVVRIVDLALKLEDDPATNQRLNMVARPVLDLLLSRRAAIRTNAFLSPNLQAM